MPKKSLLGLPMKRNLMEVGKVVVLQRRSSNAACLVMMMVKNLIASMFFHELLEVSILISLIIGFPQLI